MGDLVGQKLGNYQLVRFLGRGGFADVYLGEHQRLKTQAAIKVLHTHLTDKDVDGFLKEAQFIAHLEHPHIIRVLDFDVTEDGAPFLVMSYAPNGSLRELHPRGTAIPLTTIVSYVKQVADALQYAHEEKLIHRDIKPENMLLGRRGEVLLSDFGIALVAQSSRYQSTQEMAGTMAYMAPEQIQGKPRPASDQYALGIVVYEWLSGERPFHGSFTEIVAQHLATSPTPLREKIPTVPSAIQEVVMIALAKDSKERFASVQAFANALERASHPDDLTYVTPLAPTVRDIPIPPPPPPPPPFNRPSPAITPVSLPPAQYAVPSKPAGSVVFTFRLHTGRVNAVAWSPDGSRIASGSYDKKVYVWEAAEGNKASTEHNHAKAVNAVAWSPDGSYIASGGDDKVVQVWQESTGRDIGIYRGHSQRVSSLAWSPDGIHIASGSYDQTVQVWDTTTGTLHFNHRVSDPFVSPVKWSPDGQYILFAGNTCYRQVWNSLSPGTLVTYGGHLSSVETIACSPNGQYVASAGYDTTVQIWNTANGQHIYTYRGHTGSVFAVTWSPDGKCIASGDAGGKIHVWNITNGKLVHTYRGHSGIVLALAWSLDGRYIASGGADTTVQVWVAPH
jgi:eukaryotic-like serine/threonine-protein kinase